MVCMKVENVCKEVILIESDISLGKEGKDGMRGTVINVAVSIDSTRVVEGLVELGYLEEMGWKIGHGGE